MCTANVCRSPRAEYELREVFARAPRFSTVKVASVGTDAARAEEICDLVREGGQTDGLAKYSWMDFADRHRSSPLTAATIGQAKLILTAGREHRAIVAKIAPDARARTFTLREALWLGEGFTTDAAGHAAVEEFAAYANANRGVRPLPAPRRRLVPWGRPPGHVLSIADTHGRAPKEHRATIADVAEVSGRVGTLITGAH